MKASLKLAVSAFLATSVLSAWVPAAETAPTMEERGLLDGVVNGVVGVADGVVDGVVVDTVNGLLVQVHNAVLAGDGAKVLDAVKQLTAATHPRDVDDAAKVLTALSMAFPTNIFDFASHLIANGLIFGTVDDLLKYAYGLSSTAENGHENSNPDPPTSVYPKASCDAPYSISEDKLRAAIYIPDDFTYGNKTPVVLLPGTATTGYISFAGNFIPLLSGSDWADPVWVNVPNFLLDDVQTNAEYAAYAINYIASITGRDVSVIGWSQGNVDAQWAFKYWPSTRRVTTDHIAISADFKGTVIIGALAPLRLALTPSVIQQGSGSQLIKTLRSHGGDSAYVPTTSIFSGFLDEIVQPQTGKDASAYMLDARNIGVLNAEVQEVCTGMPAGTLYTHEGVLYNPLAFALAKDAITHNGPGDLSRIKLSEVCSTYLTSGLELDDLLITENTVPIAVLNLLLYNPKPTTEPKIKSYAQLVPYQGFC